MMRKIGVVVMLLSLICFSGCDSTTKQASAPADDHDERKAAPAEQSAKTAGDDEKETSAKPAGDNATQIAKARNFIFQYKFKVKDLPSVDDAEKNQVRVWLPVPPTNENQTVTRLSATAPSELSEHEEQQFGNHVLYFDTAIPASKEFVVDITYDVVRNEVLRKLPAEGKPEPLAEGLRQKLLAANEMVPTSGKPLQLLNNVELPRDKLALAQKLYNIVDDHVVYKKEGAGWGRGDSNWVCNSGYGNCTDFHSLFMSLARSQGLPARFEMGFSIPTDKPEGPITGYHCWAWFYLDDRGWIPVDISEADKHPEMKTYYFGNLTADRIMFTAGRDLELSPQPAHTPLNFLIYPYIEVGGEVLPKESVELQFTYQDKN